MPQTGPTPPASPNYLPEASWPVAVVQLASDSARWRSALRLVLPMLHR